MGNTESSNDSNKVLAPSTPQNVTPINEVIRATDSTELRVFGGFDGILRSVLETAALTWLSAFIYMKVVKSIMFSTKRNSVLDTLVRSLEERFRNNIDFRESSNFLSRLLKDLFSIIGLSSSSVFDDMEISHIANVIVPEQVDITFDDIGGLEDQKEEIQKTIVLPILLANELRQHTKLINVPKGLLLYGPPGTGKTMLAKAIAKANHAVFINVSAASILNMYVGQSEKAVTALFSLAAKVQPSVIFIDEIDTFLNKRSEMDHNTSKSIKGLFMSMWDGLYTSEFSQVTIVAATNCPEQLDDAILRRLSVSIYVGLPDFDQRRKILRTILKKEPIEDGLDTDLLAKVTDGFSGSDLHTLCQQAARMQLKELANKDEIDLDELSLRKITYHDFLEALKMLPPVVQRRRAAQSNANTSNSNFSFDPNSFNPNMAAMTMLMQFAEQFQQNGRGRSNSVPGHRKNRRSHGHS